MEDEQEASTIANGGEEEPKLEVVRKQNELVMVIITAIYQVLAPELEISLCLSSFLPHVMSV